MTFRCQGCQFETTVKSTYNKHLISKKHKDKHPGETTPVLVQDEKAGQQLYECKACKFSTLTKGAYKKHEATKRHIKAQEQQAQQTRGQAQVQEQRGQAQAQAKAEQTKGQAQQTRGQEQAQAQAQAQAKAQTHVQQTQPQQNHIPQPLAKEVNKERKKRFKHHMGALRLLQELSSGKITENDIAEYMKKHHPDTVGVSMSDDDDDDDDDDDKESKSDVSDSEEEEPEPSFQNRTQENTEEPETFTFYINGPPPTTPPPVPHVRHQPYYYEFPPETPGGKLPTPPTDYKLPLFIENRRKIAESNDPEVEAQQYADIRQFIIDFLDGTQTRTGPDVERFRWQLNEITKLFVHNNMNNMQNRPNLPGII